MESIVQRASSLNRFRRHPRVRIPAPFVCALSKQSSGWLKRPVRNFGVVHDLSIRGARVSTDAAIKPGDVVTVSLHLPKQIKSAEIVMATVRWTKNQFVGLAFTKLSVSSHERLKRYVMILSRTAA